MVKHGMMTASLALARVLGIREQLFLQAMLNMSDNINNDNQMIQLTCSNKSRQ